MSQLHSQRNKLSRTDKIVIIVGPTGVGKSTFIEYATGQNGGTVGHGLESYTADIRTVRVKHPIHGHSVAFVDTPGFGDTYKSDTEILTTIAEWFVKSYKGKINIDAIVYLHRISDNRVNGSVLKNLHILPSLLGSKAMPNVVIATTMWSKVTEAEGIAREEELERKFWNRMLAKGCRVERFKDTRNSAWEIIDSLARTDGAKVLLPQEMVDIRLRLNETGAGVTLNKELERLIKDQKDAARRLRDLVNSQDNELVVQELSGRKAELEDTIRKTAAQLHQMKIPLTRKIRLFFKDRDQKP